MSTTDRPPRSAALRWLRAACLAGVAVGSGVIAHATSGGLMPRWPWLVAIAMAGLGLSYAGLARPASRLRVVLLTAGGQTLVHGTLTALAGHRGDPPIRHVVTPRFVPAPPLPTSGSRRGTFEELTYGRSHTGATQVAVPAPVQHLLADLTGPHAVMALAHLAAAVVVGLWLAGGERALWTIVALLVDGLRAVVALAVPPVPVRRPAPLVSLVRDPATLPLLDSVLLARGP